MSDVRTALSMADANLRDSHDQQRITDLARTIDAFLADPPHRLPPVTREQLERARDGLRETSAHIVVVWD